MNVKRKSIAVVVIDVYSVHVDVGGLNIYFQTKNIFLFLFLVGRGLANCYLETPPNTPSSNQDEYEYNSEESGFEQKLSLSSPADDRQQTTSLPFSSGVTMRETVSKRPTSASVINGTAFKMMSISGNQCARCSKTVYSAEEVKAAGKVKAFKFNEFSIEIKQKVLVVS